MPILLLKVTLLLTIPLACLPLMRRASAAMRHLLCAVALGGAFFLPLTLLDRGHSISIPLKVVLSRSALAGVTARAAHSNAAPLLFALWALGSAILLARLALGYRRVSMLVRNASPAVQNPAEAGGYSTADVCVPMVSGLVQPTILMPLDAVNWPAEQRLAALRHERAHVERHDLHTGLVGQIACALYWFHPLVWAVARQMRHEQETACDDAVIRSGFEPIIYAEALVATARQFTSTSFIGCHMLTQKTLKSRIARLLDGKVSRTTSKAALRRVTLLLAVAVAGIALLNADEPYSVGDGVSAPHVIFKIDPSYSDAARDARIEGSVVLSIVVGADGKAHEINVLKSLDPALDVNAVEAVQKWRFAPGLREGAPVSVRANISINFKLM